MRDIQFNIIFLSAVFDPKRKLCVFINGDVSDEVCEQTHERFTVKFTIM